MGMSTTANRENRSEALNCGINFFDTADVYGFGHSGRFSVSARFSKE